MRPGQDARIAHLFRRGNSLDLICELGVLYGWTRTDAKRVLVERGWALTWTGRLQPQYMREAMVVTESVADATPERLLNAGIDHESTEIRRAAASVERALEKLRMALLAQEQADAVAAAEGVLSDAFAGRFGPSVPETGVRAS